MRVLKQEEMSQVSGGTFGLLSCLTKLFSFCAPKPVVCAPKPVCAPAPVCAPKPAVCAPKPVCAPAPVCAPKTYSCK